MAAPRTETAIARIRELIASGRLAPGSRLPPEHELATQLGLSRNTAREAVRALVTARVLDVPFARASPGRQCGLAAVMPLSP